MTEVDFYFRTERIVDCCSPYVMWQARVMELAFSFLLRCK